MGRKGSDYWMSNVKLILEHSDVNDEEIIEYSSKVKSIHDELTEMAKDKNEDCRMVNASW